MSSNVIARMLEANVADRKLRAYAYLQASFATQPKHGDQVIDLLDCFIPFFVEGIAEQAGEQLDLPKLQAFLSKNFSFSIPLYAIDQLTSRLQNIGALNWNSVIKAHFCADIREKESKELANRVIIDEDFEIIEEKLKNYSSLFSISEPYGAKSWREALINFLKYGSQLPHTAPTTVKGVILSDPSEVDNFIAARFVQNARMSDQEIFERITRIYTGVLIEDFTATVQELGSDEQYDKLTIFYDTTVLLRLLGASGDDMRKATTEMHTTLKELGCATQYFEHNRDEVENILLTIIEKHDAGGILYGETAEAIFNGEITLGVVRDLSATFVERLAAQNVFLSKFAYENTRTANYYQIDEPAFEDFLQREALRARKAYSLQNIKKDARSLALIMRLRREVRTRNVPEAKCLFVASNRLLVRSGQRFVAEKAGFGWRNVPPMMTTGQIATLAWLVASKDLEQRRVSQELLANCYGAVKPDDEWTTAFLNALEEFKENKPDSKILDSAVYLSTARRIAQDQSLGNSAVFRKLSSVVIFERAEKEAKAREQAQAALAEQDIKSALEEGRRQGLQESEEKGKDKHRRNAVKIASAFVRIVEVALIIAFVSSILIGDVVFQAISFALAFLSLLEMLGVRLLRRALDGLRNWLSGKIEALLLWED